MPACRYVEENDLAAIMCAKSSAGVTPEGNLGEHIACTPPPSTNKTAHSGFKPRGKSKTETSVAAQKGLMT